MGRQQVHLSGSVDDAREVGDRHADDPVVLEVDAAGMLAAGLGVVERGRSTYTTGQVPPPTSGDSTDSPSPSNRP